MSRARPSTSTTGKSVRPPAPPALPPAPPDMSRARPSTEPIASNANSCLQSKMICGQHLHPTSKEMAAFINQNTKHKTQNTKHKTQNTKKQNKTKAKHAKHTNQKHQKEETTFWNSESSSLFFYFSGTIMKS